MVNWLVNSSYHFTVLQSWKIPLEVELVEGSVAKDFSSLEDLQKKGAE